MADNAYSRFVFWAKVLLPLAALAILSTLFLVAETLDPDKAIPYAEVDVEKILREQGVSRPQFGTRTQSGVEISMSADAVRPVLGANARFRGTELVALIALPNGRSIDITSPEGLIDIPGSEVILRGSARLSTSDGYRVLTDQLVTRYDIVFAQSPGPVSASGPGGTIDGGSMVLSEDETTGDVTLVFKDGVRLIYQPATE